MYGGRSYVNTDPGNWVPSSCAFFGHSSIRQSHLGYRISIRFMFMWSDDAPTQRVQLVLGMLQFITDWDTALDACPPGTRDTTTPPTYHIQSLLFEVWSFSLYRPHSSMAQSSQSNLLRSPFCIHGTASHGAFPLFNGAKDWFTWTLVLRTTLNTAVKPRRDLHIAVTLRSMETFRSQSLQSDYNLEWNRRYELYVLISISISRMR